MYRKDGCVIDGLDVRQVGKRLLDIGFERGMLKSLHDIEIGELVDITQIPCCLKVTEGVESHA